MSEIHIVTASDENYLIGVVGQLTSAAINLESEHTLVAHIILNNVLDEKVSVVESALAPLAKFGLVLDIIRVDERMLEGLSRANTHLTLSSYLRLWIPRLLPHLDYAIYADCDTITHASLAPLWEMTLNAKLIIGVAESQIGAVHDRAGLGMDLDAPYINSGVLGMNLAALRDAGTFEKCIELAMAPPIHFHQQDQDAINAICWRDIDLIDRKWNSLVMLSENEVSLIPLRSCILHTVTGTKPWYFKRKGSHGLVRLFYDYLAVSEWPNALSPEPRYQQKVSAFDIAAKKFRRRIALVRGRHSLT